MKRSKGILAIFLAAAMIFCLCSCSSSRAKQLTSLMSEESTKIEEQSTEIIRCLTEGDKEGFRSLFCSQVRQSDTFSQEIDDIFDFFSCEIYIKSEIDDSASGGTSSYMGKRTKWYVTPEITYIEVLEYVDENSEELTRRYYGVLYYWEIINTEHPELEGLHYLTINLLNTENAVEIGTYEWT